MPTERDPAKLKVALPAGELRQPTAALLLRAGLDLADYAEGSRSYRHDHYSGYPIAFRVFHERDIPIQIALGNYDAAICGLAWVEELRQRYPTDAVVKVAGLGFGDRSIYAAVALPSPGATDPAAIAAIRGLRIVSEYPNLADAFALSARLPAYRVYPVWGAVEAYPPEDADLALLAAADEDAVRALGLVPIFRLLHSQAWLIVNRNSLQQKDMSRFLNSLLTAAAPVAAAAGLTLPGPLARQPALAAPHPTPGDMIRLALPDGHQQPHAAAILDEVGLAVPGYGAVDGGRRLPTALPYLEVKVIRPQDMPQQVALGHFDLAVTGRDWLLDHLYRFPSSPVQEVADLGRGRYVMAAVVQAELPASTIEEAVDLWRQEGRQVIRLASEYINIADHLARQHHLGRYQVIPISGASEGFVPKDAEILIEGTETGQTLAANRLKVLKPLFESTTCLIASKRAASGRRAALVAEVIDQLRQATAPARLSPARGG